MIINKLTIFIKETSLPWIFSTVLQPVHSGQKHKKIKGVKAWETELDRYPDKQQLTLAAASYSEPQILASPLRWSKSPGSEDPVSGAEWNIDKITSFKVMQTMGSYANTELQAVASHTSY